MPDIISEIIRREGGYVNHPADKGGPTKYGITQATLSGWRGRAATAAEVEALTEMEARTIYTDLFVVKPRFGEIGDPRIRELVVDCGVNHGPGNAAKMLQRAAGVPDDGAVGPKTLAAVNAADAWALYLRLLAERIRFYGRIIKRDQTQAVFAEGWLNRAAEFLEVKP